MTTPAQDVSDQCLGSAFRELACSGPLNFLLGIETVIQRARELQQAQVVGEFDGAYMDIDEDGFPIYRWKQGHTVYAVMPTKDAISFLVTEGRRVAYVGKPITTPQSSAPNED